MQAHSAHRLVFGENLISTTIPFMGAKQCGRAALHYNTADVIQTIFNLGSRSSLQSPVGAWNCYGASGFSEAPWGTKPSSTKRQMATASFRASAITPILRDLPEPAPNVPRYHWDKALVG